MNKSYHEVYLASAKVETNLKIKGIVSNISQGRFKDYQLKVHNLARAWYKLQQKKQTNLLSLDAQDIFALSELREIIEILGPIIQVFDDLPISSKATIKQKIRTLLTGPTYLLNEGSKTEARNIQFEIRLASKLIESGYKLHFFENPDIAVDVDGRKYAIECKRITGSSPRSIQNNISKAVNQLLEYKDGYNAGIVALDVSALLDDRQKLLISTDKIKASDTILDELEKLLRIQVERNIKIRDNSDDHLISLFYNYTGPFAIPNENQLGWCQGTAVMVFNKENPIKATSFISDFQKYREASSFD